MKIRFSHQDVYDGIARGMIHKAMDIETAPVYITQPIQVNGERNEYLYKLVFKYLDDTCKEFLVTVCNDWLQVISNIPGYRFVATYDFFTCKVSISK